MLHLYLGLHPWLWEPVFNMPPASHHYPHLWDLGGGVGASWSWSF